MKIVIEMPKIPQNCFDCPIAKNYGEEQKLCPLISMISVFSNRNVRPPYCPLKEYNSEKV